MSPLKDALINVKNNVAMLLSKRNDTILELRRRVRELEAAVVSASSQAALDAQTIAQLQANAAVTAAAYEAEEAVEAEEEASMLQALTDFSKAIAGNLDTDVSEVATDVSIDATDVVAG